MKREKNDNLNFFKSRQIADEVIDVIKTEAPYNNKYHCLNEYILKNKNSEELIEILLDKDKMNALCSNYARQEKHDGAKRLNNLLQKRAKRKQTRIRLYSAISSVAAVVAIVSILIFRGNDDNQPQIIHNRLQPSSAPVLVLASGENIILDNTRKIADNDSEIEATNQKLIYKNSGANQDKISYNTIIVPDKCTYHIQLEDSTEIILNENSELRYPTKFTESRREVFLKGEGYFIVSKMPKPFVVTCLDVKVKVYGTQFNINARDTSIIKTALISGSIGVTVSDNREILIEPNQIITVNRITNTNDICEVDASRYVAWTIDCLRYDSERLDNILEELTYWYGVEFVFKNEKHKNEILTASFFKDTSLENIIALLSQITNLKFTKEGGHYIIK